MKDELPSNAAKLIFQLRTLLNGTSGMLEVATSTQDVSEQADYIRTALVAAKQASSILNELFAESPEGPLSSPESHDDLSASLVAEINPHRLKILLAEDNLINQRMVSKLLERRGHSVVIADNGKSAVEAAAREVFDLVLMDIKMPVMDGLDAASFIRAHERRTGSDHVPIVALTAVGEGELATIAEVMDEVIQKPFQTNRLIRTVEAFTPGDKSRSKREHSKVKTGQHTRSN